MALPIHTHSLNNSSAHENNLLRHLQASWKSAQPITLKSQVKKLKSKGHAGPLAKEVKIEIFHKKQQLFDFYKVDDSTFSLLLNAKFQY